MSLRSALYVGHVAHHRLTPQHHALRHRVYWMLLDLEELPELNERLRFFSHNHSNLTSLQDYDHGDGSARSLLEQAREHIRHAGIDDAGMRIQLLCMPRVAGYDFNPLSVYFCTNGQSELAALIYEVNNTFGGRHSYVIPTAPAERVAGATVHQSCRKTFYVSPFMDLDLTYRFRTALPADRVRIAVQARKNDAAIINTSLIAHRRALTDFNLLRLAVTHPVLPFKVTGAIYWHALRMWLRGFSINPTPASTTNTVTIVNPTD